MNLKNACLISILSLSATLIALACSGNMDSLESPLAPTSTPSTSVPSKPSTETKPTVAPEQPTECERIQLKRSSIKAETDCEKGVRFYAEAADADYFNVHLGGLNNGPILGPNKPNEWSKWYKLDAGDYTYTLAMEQKRDGKVIQCDHHNKTFKIEPCRVPPECPRNAMLDISVYERREVIVDPCPKYKYFSYTATSNLPITELSLPSGCTPSDPMNGTCQFLVPKEGSTSHTISGKSYRTDPKMLCAQDSETMVVEPCQECRACEDYKMTVFKRQDGSVFIGDPPSGMYYTVNGGGHYHDGQVVPPPELDCNEAGRIVVNLYDEHCSRLQWCQKWEFTYVGECFCEDLELTPGCYRGNVDTVAHFKSYFQIPGDYCIRRVKKVGKKNKACFPSPVNADWAVVKGGPQFRLYVGVKKGQQLCTYCPEGVRECKKPDVSHASFFRCCPE